jgi:hypothetical protein
MPPFLGFSLTLSRRLLNPPRQRLPIAPRSQPLQNIDPPRIAPNQNPRLAPFHALQNPRRRRIRHRRRQPVEARDSLIA